MAVCFPCFQLLYSVSKFKGIEIVGRPNLVPLDFAILIPSCWRSLIFVRSFSATNDKAYPTRKMILALLNQLSKYALKNDIVEKTYSQFIDVGINEGKANRKPFTKEEIQKLFDNVDRIEFVDTVLIMIYSGLRVGELLDLKIENIHLDERYMVGGLKTEAGRNRIIPINKKIEPFVRKYYEKNKDKEYLITNFKGNQMCYSNYRRKKFDSIMEKLEMKHVPHECRHTFASLMNSANANRLCVKMIIGHSSCGDITEGTYTHKTLEELIEAIDLI